MTSITTGRNRLFFRPVSWYDSQAFQHAAALIVNIGPIVTKEAEEFIGPENEYGNYESDHLSVRVNPAMTNTVEYLLKLGCVTEKDLVTYLELYPERYSDAEKAYFYDRFIEDTETIVTYGPGAAGEAIGVIGGADGPTAVFVGGSTHKLHTACSSLHFEAVEAVQWRAVFSEKLMEDIEICLV